MKLLDARLGSTIRRARGHHGLTQRDLARRRGISLRHISAIEAGANFSVALLAAIASELPEVAAVVGECLRAEISASTSVGSPSRRGS